MCGSCNLYVRGHMVFDERLWQWSVPYYVMLLSA